MNGFEDGSKEDNIRHAIAGDKPSSAEIKQMPHIIAALNLIRMNLGMYPPGHTRIAESFDKAFTVIQKALRNRSELTFGVAGETLLFGETVLDKKNASIRDYARTLNNLRILSFSLYRGLKKEELIEFNRILSSKPSDIWAQGKIEGILTKAGVISVKVNEADADQYNLAGERKIVQGEAKKKIKDEEFWQDYISRLKDADNLDAKDATRYLNEQRQHWQAAVLSYEGMVQNHFYETRKGRKISAEHYETLTIVSGLIRDLHPDLKKQLLEVVERQISLQPETALIMENLKCFPREMFLEIIGQANERKSQISPSLIMILQKMSKIEEDKTIDTEMSREDLSSEDLEQLLKREEHEKYVPEEYDQMLKKAAQTSQIDLEIDEEKFPIHEYLKTIAEDQIHFRICQLILALMDEETTDEEDYLLYATGLMRAVPELIKSGQISFLTDVIETLRRHGQEREKPSEKIRQKAMSSLKPFSDQEYMAKFVAPFILRGLTDTNVMTKLLTASGKQNVPWLFDLYLDPLSLASAALVDILKGFGKNAIDEAIKRLTEQSPQKIIPLLTFLRAAADKSIVTYLKDLFDHEDWNVKREVIETLFYYNDPAAVDILRKSLRSRNREELFYAVNLTCSYRVRDLINDLMSMLKTFVIREEDTILNDWIIKRLGATGDPAFVPCLEKISQIRFSLTPKQLSRMKLILYGSLVNFPRESVQKMLEQGKRSYNKKIKAICVKILEQ
jgi:hypothetical protein